jgi:transcriptional regulator with XRE-family HTH domain
MPTRQNPADEAARRAKYQMDQVVRDLRARRLMAGLSLSAVAAALGCSRQLVAKWEQRALAPRPIRLAAWGATLGLDISIRAFDAGSPLRDAGQLRLLGRARHAVGTRWAWRTEVPVTSNPLDRRAIDAVLTAPRGSVGLEAITRLVDAQAQVRAALLKQEASGVDRMILVLADSRHNRAAVREGAATLRPAFALATRAVLRALRRGELPKTNGTILV